jgi:hypothetical protein
LRETTMGFVMSVRLSAWNNFACTGWSLWILYLNIFRKSVEEKNNKYLTWRHVHSVQQKPSGLIFRTSRSVSHVRYSCHHNSSRFTFPLFVHSWRLSVSHSLQSITPRIY